LCSRKCKHIVLTYDIACQYSINLVKRFEAQFPDMADVIKRVTLLIGKLHLVNHTEICQYWWSLNYTPCVGWTDGEHIEAGWAEQKQAGGSTKEMNHGHRHDTLSDFQNDWNWLKVQKMGEWMRGRSDT
ncbi:hypothetical protein PAXINDRAFT_75869, partial [Paxillus involutus ATCC 200175]